MNDYQAPVAGTGLAATGVVFGIEGLLFAASGLLIVGLALRFGFRPRKTVTEA